MKLLGTRTWRAFAGAAVLALAIAGLVACGGDGDGTQSLTLTASGSGENVQIQAPESADPGIAEITLDNRTDGRVDAQLIRVTGEHPPADVIRVFGGVLQGKPLPDWLYAGGGVGTVSPDVTDTVTEDLEPGTYYVFNTDASGPPDPKAVPAFEVTGEPSEDELPEADATVRAIDYGFEATGLKRGENQIRFENAGAQPHHILASPVEPGTTVRAATDFLLGDRQPAVVRLEGSDNTAVLEGGDSQNLTLTLGEPGEYVLYCFVTDRQGGPPHVAKGMVDKVEVN